MGERPYGVYRQNCMAGTGVSDFPGVGCLHSGCKDGKRIDERDIGRVIRSW